MIRAVIFDLDGTLANTLSGISYFINETAKRLNLGVVPTEQVRIFVGNGARNLVRRVTQYLGKPETEEEFFALFNSLYDADPTRLLTAYDGISEMLKALKHKGIALAVLSNKPHSTTVPVCESLFPETLSFVQGHKEGFRHKPHLDGMAAVLSALGVTAAECMYVGDSEVDMQTGKNAGMFTVGVTWGFRDEALLWQHGADRVVHHPRELISLAASNDLQ